LFLPLPSVHFVLLVGLFVGSHSHASFLPPSMPCLVGWAVYPPCRGYDVVFLRGLTECEGWSPLWFLVAIPRFNSSFVAVYQCRHTSLLTSRVSCSNSLHILPQVLVRCHFCCSSFLLQRAIADNSCEAWLGLHRFVFIKKKSRQPSELLKRKTHAVIIIDNSASLFPKIFRFQ